jgi:hypothetical protein
MLPKSTMASSIAGGTAEGLAIRAACPASAAAGCAAFPGFAVFFFAVFDASPRAMGT